MSTARIFRYVTFNRIPAFLAAGWDWKPAEPPASAYSVIMEWLRPGEPVVPVEPSEVEGVE